MSSPSLSTLLQQLRSIYTCPISLSLLQSPFITFDGHSYQKQNILDWFQQSQIYKSPLTGIRLNNNQIIENFTLKKLIKKIQDILPEICEKVEDQIRELKRKVRKYQSQLGSRSINKKENKVKAKNMIKDKEMIEQSEKYKYLQMQEQKQDNPNYISCAMGQPVSLFCLYPQCPNPKNFFLCSFSSCPCHKFHLPCSISSQFCQFSSIQSYLNKKHNQIQQTTVYLINCVIKNIHKNYQKLEKELKIQVKKEIEQIQMTIFGVEFYDKLINQAKIENNMEVKYNKSIKWLKRTSLINLNKKIIQNNMKIQQQSYVQHNILNQLQRLIQMHQQNSILQISHLHKQIQQSLTTLKTSQMLQNQLSVFSSLQSSIISSLQDFSTIFNFFQSSNHQSNHSHHNLQQFPSLKRFSLLFKASEHQFNINKFFQLCENEQNTIVIIKTENDKVIGGYSKGKHKYLRKNGWYECVKYNNNKKNKDEQQQYRNNDYNYHNDQNQSDPAQQFLFSVTQNQKYPLKPTSSFSFSPPISHISQSLQQRMIFFGFYQLCIRNNCNLSEFSCESSNINNFFSYFDYSNHMIYKKHEVDVKNFKKFNGKEQYCFRAKEWECWKVEFKEGNR